MKTLRALLVAVGLLGVPAIAMAQDFGILESAETINQGNTKLFAAPLFIFGRNGGADEQDIVLGLGYGFTPNFDLEGKAVFGDSKIFGGNGEYWLMKHDPIDLSLIAGAHFQDLDGPRDVWGIDLTLLGSKHLGRRVEFFTGLDTTFDRFTKSGGKLTQVHIVPGIEYAISDQLDFEVELGVALNDNSRHYVGFGLAYYLR